MCDIHVKIHITHENKQNTYIKTYITHENVPKSYEDMYDYNMKI